MGFLSVLSFAHKLTAERLSPGDWLSTPPWGPVPTLCSSPRRPGRAAGCTGSTFSRRRWLLPASACGWPRKEAPAALAPVTLLQQSHAAMAEAVPPAWRGTVSAVMFNLGYLPAGDADKTIITEPGSTLAALEAALALLRPGGIITAVLYPGHEGGGREAAAVEAWAAGLAQQDAQTIVYRQLQRGSAPYVVAVEKRRS